MAKRPAADASSKSDAADAASKSTAAAKAKDVKDKNKPHDGGWRETIESLAMAIILALLFKGYVAEAFVIPTGSMAPTLQGRHRDICCSQCGYWYQATASEEVDRQGYLLEQHVISGTCPVCRYTQTYDAAGQPNEASFSGDRIIVSKFAYEIAEPQRWDVIVFKYPEEATQNYIKRLVGLPGEMLTVSGGNVYVRPANQPDAVAKIARKPPHKLTAMLQIVDDSDHIPESLVKLAWPPRWREKAPQNGAASAWKTADGGKTFACETAPTDLAWLRYRHVVPSYEDWETITIVNRLPAGVQERRGELITDFYAYNTSVLVQGEKWPPSPGAYRPAYGNHQIEIKNVPERLRLSHEADKVKFAPDLVGPGVPCDANFLGNHWVDDLAVECLAEIQDSSGTIALSLVRAGVHHRCTIDIATGAATLSRENAAGKALEFTGEGSEPALNPKAATSVQGAGYYRLRLTNCDHELLLFVNGKAVKFDVPTSYASDEIVAPQWTAQDGLDLEPAGVGIAGARAKLSHLRIYRDKYYIASDRSGLLTDYENDYYGTATPSGKPSLPEVFASPDLWSSSGLFLAENRRALEFEIGPDQFFPMGDNSPGSYDARYWPSHNYVERDLLIGKALVIYWPHSWNRPPLLPNFKRMGLIK